MRFAPAFLVVLLVASCSKREEPTPRTGSAESPPKDPKDPPAANPTKISRADFNRFAVRLNLPVYWIADTNDNGTPDPDERAALLFYPTAEIDFDAAYQQIVAAATTEVNTKDEEVDPRIRLVRKDLDQGRATLVLNTVTADEKPFVTTMLEVAAAIDELYDTQTGAAALREKIAPDASSQSLFRRNRTPKCIAPMTEKDPACSAIADGTKPVVSVYPEALAKPAVKQNEPTFCAELEKVPAAQDPFTVVALEGGAYKSVPYTIAYKGQMEKIAVLLEKAATQVDAKGEAALVAYLTAAANSFRTNDWKPSDEAWAKMNVDNSKWYVRVAPDEVYWDPCAHKAGFHLTFARIDQASKAWQDKLAPIQQEMEDAIAKLAGPPYKARKVTFHLPDFIGIVVNAGDDRDPLGATIGQSLPNVGPVANEGRGRTVAMVNLYLDQDSREARKAQAESLFDAASMKLYSGTPEAGLAGTILHEATHNLGPAHEYKVSGKTDDVAFGGPIASVMEELKAQTGAWFLTEMLREKKLVDDAFAQQTYTDAIVWACGHVSQGMYAGDGKTRKAYSNLAAIQLGYLLDKGVLSWDAKAKAANGKDDGAFTIHPDKIVAVAKAMMTEFAGIKARGDKAAAEALLAKYVDSDKIVPHAVISERFLRHPKSSFVYAVK